MSTPHVSRLARYWKWLVAMLLLLLLFPFSSAVAEPTQTADKEVWVVKLSGGIGPASSDFVIGRLDEAAAAEVPLLVIELDTPGGLDKSMRQMIKHIIASPVPVATFVHPSGSRAASAGTYILYASHIAEMAPAPNLGL